MLDFSAGNFRTHNPSTLGRHWTSSKLLNAPDLTTRATEEVKQRQKQKTMHRMSIDETNSCCGCCCWVSDSVCIWCAVVHCAVVAAMCRVGWSGVDVTLLPSTFPFLSTFARKFCNRTAETKTEQMRRILTKHNGRNTPLWYDQINYTGVPKSSMLPFSNTSNINCHFSFGYLIIHCVSKKRHWCYTL